MTMRKLASLLLLALLTGCHDDHCSNNSLISDCGRHVRDIGSGDSRYSEFEFEGLTVYGDMRIGDFREIRDLLGKEIQAEETLLHFVALPPDTLVQAWTCTDCNLGPLSGAGRIFELELDAGVWRIAEIHFWIS
jgi:hypothetical protein